MSEMVKIIINDKEMGAEVGSLLIDKLLDENIHIPHFCYHKSLGKDGNCRMCMVEIKGQKRPQISCDTFVTANMEVSTVSENIMQVRKDILELQLLNHPIDCPTCDQAGECKLQDFYMESGFYSSRMELNKKNHARKREDLGANVMLDQERCVLCTRCVRFCSDVTKTNELGVVARADHSVISTFPGMKLHNPYAMNVVDLCPVGALTSKDFRFQQRVWFLESFNAICNGCSKGCNIEVDHRKEKYKDDLIFRFRPKHNDAVNGYFMCDEGRLSYKKNQENRIQSAFINKKEADEQTALAVLYKELSANKKSLILVGPNLSLEELANTQAFAKVIGANISAYSPTYIDETFGDDYLKDNDKAANRAAFAELGISQEKDDFKNYLKEAKLVVTIENNYFDTNLKELDQKKIIACFANECTTVTHASVVIPMASFYEKNGTYINKDGIKQKVVSGMNRDKYLMTASNLIENIQSMLEKGNI